MSRRRIRSGPSSPLYRYSAALRRLPVSTLAIALVVFISHLLRSGFLRLFQLDGVANGSVCDGALSPTLNSEVTHAGGPRLKDRNSASTASGYVVLLNAYARPQLLPQALAHYGGVRWCVCVSSILSPPSFALLTHNAPRFLLPACSAPARSLSVLCGAPILAPHPRMCGHGFHYASKL